MKPDPLKRLAALARQSPEPALSEMPFGFDTRLAALVSACAKDAENPWEWFAPRGAAGAAIVCAAALAANHFTPQQSPESRMAAAIVEGALK